MSIAQLRTGKLMAGRKIARSLGVSENAIDDTIVAQAALMTAIIDGRRQAGMPVQIGHSAFRKAAAALEALAQVRDLVVDCHDDLAGVRDHLRMDGADLGCSPDKGMSPSGQVDQAEAA